MARQSFKTKGAALRALIGYLVAPLLFIGANLILLLKMRSFGVITDEQFNQPFFFFLFIAIFVLIYSWYKMFRTYFDFMRNDIDKLPDIPETVVCVKCKEPFSGRDLTAFICPKCGSSVEDLKGFYDRHPELR